MSMLYESVKERGGLVVVPSNLQEYANIGANIAVNKKVLEQEQQNK